MWNNVKYEFWLMTWFFLFLLERGGRGDCRQRHEGFFSTWSQSTGRPRVLPPTSGSVLWG